MWVTRFVNRATPLSLAPLLYDLPLCVLRVFLCCGQVVSDVRKGASRGDCLRGSCGIAAYLRSSTSCGLLAKARPTTYPWAGHQGGRGKVVGTVTGDNWPGSGSRMIMDLRGPRVQRFFIAEGRRDSKRARAPSRSVSPGSQVGRFSRTLHGLRHLGIGGGRLTRYTWKWRWALAAPPGSGYEHQWLRGDLWSS